MMALHFTITKQVTTLISRAQPFWPRKSHTGSLRELKSKNLIQHIGQTCNLVMKLMHAGIRFSIRKNPEHQVLNLRVKFEIRKVIASMKIQSRN